MRDLDQAIEELRARAAHYAPERYPMQHATAQFHLGSALLTAGDPHAAAACLRTAVTLFAPQHVPVEHAKARMMLGIALRACGQHAGASAELTAAAQGFAQESHPQEEAAARHNLGLVRRDAGDLDGAADAFRQALAVFEAQAAPQAVIAARELGATLLSAGAPQEAVDALNRGLALTGARTDPQTLGDITNVLGLAYLAAARPDDAVGAFTTAADVNPRSVRPEGYAMAKANIALACEQAGDLPRARLAAAQAAAVAEAPAAVTAQARAVLARVGEPSDDVHRVLDGEPPEAWAGVLRDELRRWAEADDATRAAAVRAWLEGQLARGAHAVERAHAWVGVLLELPPPAFDVLTATTRDALAALDDDARARMRHTLDRAAARFHVPQWQRLQDAFALASAGETPP